MSGLVYPSTPPQDVEQGPRSGAECSRATDSEPLLVAARAPRSRLHRGCAAGLSCPLLAFGILVVIHKLCAPPARSLVDAPRDVLEQGRASLAASQVSSTQWVGSLNLTAWASAQVDSWGNFTEILSQSLLEDGNVTSWKWFGASNASVYLQVFRPENSTTYRLIGEVLCQGVLGVENSCSSNISAKKGDVIGWTFVGQAAFGYDNVSGNASGLQGFVKWVADSVNQGATTLGATVSLSQSSTRLYHIAAQLVPAVSGLLGAAQAAAQTLASQLAQQAAAAGVATSSVLPTASSPAPTPSSDACFPGEATVHVRDVGPTAILDLGIGDPVLVADPLGRPTYERVLGFLHVVYAGPERPQRYFKVTHSYGILRASANHLVFVANGRWQPLGTLTTRTMAELRVGDKVWVTSFACKRVCSSTDWVLSEVLSKQQETGARGLYAPVTRSGTLFVDGVLCSAYAAPLGTRISHATMHASLFLLRAYEMLRDTALLQRGCPTVFSQTGAVAQRVFQEDGSAASQHRDLMHPFVHLLFRHLKLHKFAAQGGSA